VLASEVLQGSGAATFGGERRCGESHGFRGRGCGGCWFWSGAFCGRCLNSVDWSADVALCRCVLVWGSCVGAMVAVRSEGGCEGFAEGPYRSVVAVTRSAGTGVGLYRNVHKTLLLYVRAEEVGEGHGSRGVRGLVFVPRQCDK
jgi:hypothetical protein